MALEAFPESGKKTGVNGQNSRLNGSLHLGSARCFKKFYFRFTMWLSYLKLTPFFQKPAWLDRRSLIDIYKPLLQKGYSRI
ncbi:hypothetical protein [Rhodoferax sp. BLA1]|uniref:hypothetical protein n=1 Tax=Rhodoferax sp. BLA1 TaxID=2576062 RepID=UPI0015D402E1|nr:hypothetical protein [Rhodoferax sp. BLA1]